MNDDIQEHLVRLESIIAFQEEAIGKLNETVASHQLQLHNMETKLDKIEEHVRVSLPSLTVDPKDDTPPPHY